MVLINSSSRNAPEPRKRFFELATLENRTHALRLLHYFHLKWVNRPTVNGIELSILKICAVIRLSIIYEVAARYRRLHIELFFIFEFSGGAQSVQHHSLKAVRMD